MKPDTLRGSWKELASHHGDASCCRGRGCQSCCLRPLPRYTPLSVWGKQRSKLSGASGFPGSDRLLPRPSWGVHIIKASIGRLPASTARSRDPHNFRPQPPDPLDVETESPQACSVLAFPLLPAVVPQYRVIVPRGLHQ